MKEERVRVLHWELEGITVSVETGAVDASTTVLKVTYGHPESLKSARQCTLKSDVETL